jgi:hypothetical protein
MPVAGGAARRDQRTKKSWSELDERQRGQIVVGGTIQLTLLGAALIDLWRRPKSQVRGSKKWWVAASFVNFVGPLAYFAFGRRRGSPAS